MCSLNNVTAVSRLVVTDARRLGGLFCLNGRANGRRRLSCALTRLRTRVATPRGNSDLLCAIGICVTRSGTSLRGPSGLILSCTCSGGAVSVIDHCILRTPIHNHCVRFSLSRDIGNGLAHVSRLTICNRASTLPFAAIAASGIAFLASRGSTSLIPPLSRGLLISIAGSARIDGAG